MANNFENVQGQPSSGVTPVYNMGVHRVPGKGEGEHKQVGVAQQLFADLLPNKDIVGGQVAKGFVADVGAPLKRVGGLYEVADIETEAEDIVGLLLLATDAFDGGRMINVVKGGTVKTKVGALRSLEDADYEALATALGGKYDATFNTIKF